MCDTENQFAKSKLSLDNLGIDHFAVKGGNELIYNTIDNTSDAPLNGSVNGTKLDQCELVNGLSSEQLVDLNAQKQIVELTTGQAMQLTDGQSNSNCNLNCNSEILNSDSTVLGTMHSNVASSSTHDNQNSQHNQNIGRPDGSAAGSGQEEHREPVHSVNASSGTGNHLALCNDGGTQCVSQRSANGTTNDADTGSTANRFVASTKPNDSSNPESASPSSQTKSTDSSSPAETPKRLHVSNVPFKYHDEHLRQLFSVSSDSSSKSPIKISSQ